jgi:ribonuclease HII
MIISASGTILSYDTAVDRIRSIIDSDPRIKREIEAKMKQIDTKNSSALKKLSAAKYLSKQERDHEIEMKKRELATYDEYIHDQIFGPLVDSALV